MENIKRLLEVNIIVLLFLITACSHTLVVDEPTHAQLEEASLAIQLGDAESALAILHSLQAQGYTTVNVWSTLASAYQSNEQPVKAIAIAYKLHQELPRNPAIQTLFADHYVKVEGEKSESIWTLYNFSQQMGFISLHEQLLLVIAISSITIVSLFLNQMKRIPKLVLIGILLIHAIILMSYTLQLYVDTFHPIAIYTDSARLPVYSNSSETTPQLFEISPSTLFYIDRVEGEWLKVVTYYGRHGWIVTKQFELLRQFNMYSQ